MGDRHGMFSMLVIYVLAGVEELVVDMSAAACYAAVGAIFFAT